MRTNEKNQPAPGAKIAPYCNTPLDQYGGTNKPYARTLRLQAVLAVLMVALSKNSDPLTYEQTSHMGELVHFAYLEAELIGAEIEEVIPV